MSIRQDSNPVFQQFGLSHDPFAPGSSSFQFYKPGRRQVLEQLIHFARYSQLLLAVTGPRGSGKTVLRHAMAAAGKDSALNVVVSALKQGDAGSILQQLGYALQVSGGDVMMLLHAAGQSALAGKDVQLLVDDAELLDDSALVLLQRLSQGDGQSRCRVFLFGEPALQNRLQELAQQPAGLEYHLIELEPWTDDEVEGYLQQRLQSAGCDLDLFTDHELGVLLDQGQGWPGLINQTAQELLMARIDSRPRRQAAAPGARSGSPLPYRHLAALLVVAFVFIFAWYQMDDAGDKAGAGKPATTRLTPEPEVVNGGQRRVALDLSVTGQGNSVQPVTQGVSTPSPGEARPQPSIQQQPALRPALAAPVPEAPAVHAPVAVPAQPVVQQAPEPVTPPPVAVAPAPAAVQQAPAPVKAAEPPRPAPAKPAEPPRPKVADTVAARNQAQTQARTQPQQPAASTAPAAGAGWYAGQPAQQFTLQVFATANEQNARQFVQANGGQYHYFRKLHNGQPLYVVTYGSFASAAAARSAIEQLPDGVKRNKPWPRTFASVRQDIR